MSQISGKCTSKHSRVWVQKSTSTNANWRWQEIPCGKREAAECAGYTCELHVNVCGEESLPHDPFISVICPGSARVRPPVVSSHSFLHLAFLKLMNQCKCTVFKEMNIHTWKTKMIKTKMCFWGHEVFSCLNDHRWLATEHNSKNPEHHY